MIMPAPQDLAGRPFGLLTVDLKNDYVQTSVQRHDRLALLDERLRALRRQARRLLYLR